MALGIQVVKYVNENYEAIRDSSGIGMAAGAGFAGFAVLLIGVALIFRPVSQRTAVDASAAAPHYSAGVIRAARQPSTGARVFFSLLGFAFGAIACFYMFMAAAARFVETETARLFSNGGFLIALILTLLSLFFGFVGLFLRGYALGRVPVYFFFGGALTYAAVRILRVNVLEWSQFLALLQ